MLLGTKDLQKPLAGCARRQMITERPGVVICLSSRMKLSLHLRLAVMTLTIMVVGQQ